MLTAATAASADAYFDALRRAEFGRLDVRRQAYLDYAGSALHAESQIRAIETLLGAEVFGNPHSEHAASRASADRIERARDTVLRFLDVDRSTHAVCFTANSTAAIKLVAEAYRFGPRAACVLSADNHNSVNGIREYARRAGARIRYLPLDEQLRLRDPEAELEDEARRGGGLFALPAQSNFSGVRHPLALVGRARGLGFDVLLDAAALVPSHPLSLRACPADFAALSFYKLFGYPTGLGALVARRDALARLARPWFAGGTVTYASVVADTYRLRPWHEGFEDGTPDFLGIAALEPGFALLDRVGMPRLSGHVSRLTAATLDGLRSLCHGGGAPLVRIYGPPDLIERGGTIAFNVCDPAGRPLAFGPVEERAAAAGISIRGGCFCNPGAAEAALGLEAERTTRCLEEMAETFSADRFASCSGTAVGAVRVSLGLANNARDVGRALDVIDSFRSAGARSNP